VVVSLAKFFPARPCLAADSRTRSGVLVLCTAAVLVKSQMHDGPLDQSLQHAVATKHVDVFGRFVLARHLVDHLSRQKIKSNHFIGKYKARGNDEETRK